MNPSAGARAPQRRLVALIVGVSWALSGSPLAADSLVADVPVPGGIAALARVVDLDPAPEPARLVVELTRILYDSPPGTPTADARLQRFTSYLSTIDELATALEPFEAAGGVALPAPSSRAERERLEHVLELMGLTLRDRNRRLSVEAGTGRRDVARIAFLRQAGLDAPGLAAQINRGGLVRVELPSDSVPVPLPAQIWSTMVFAQPVAQAHLFAAVMFDRRAALLAHGLFALDEETMAFVARQTPVLLQDLYERAAGFASFAGALRIRDGHLVSPGGAAAVPLWESIVGEPVDSVSRFTRELFRHDEGHVAYLYDALAQLDESRVRFALGLWMDDPDLRLDRFKAFVSALAAFPGLDLESRPFARPVDDAVLLLLRVRADARGAPAALPWRQFWERAFGGTDPPDDATRLLRSVREDGMIDAAWLAHAVLDADLRFRTERMNQIAFGLRVFATVDDQALPDALVAVRAFPVQRMLMLTLERMGIADPAVYAAAARHAHQLSSLDANRAFVAFGQFQGALVLIERLTRVQTIDRQTAAHLVRALAQVRIDGSRYAGGVARWLRDTLGSAIDARAEGFDQVLTLALAGARQGRAGPLPSVTWEDRSYRLDLSAFDVRSITRVLDALRPETVEHALSLAGIAESLTAPSLTLAGVRSATDDLERVGGSLVARARERSGFRLPPGVDSPSDRRERARRMARDLGRITSPGSVQDAARVGRALFDLADEVMAEALMGVAYALTLDADAGSGGGNLSARHDFGLAEPRAEVRARTPWAAPAEAVESGVPWHVIGSLLGLDVGLATQALRRVSLGGLPSAPALSSNEARVFAQTVVLQNPRDLSEDSRSALLEAIARGRQRVGALQADAGDLERAADSVHMDGWRRTAIRWSLAHAPDRVGSFFSMAELLVIGGAAPDSGKFSAWGMAAVDYDGCLCVSLVPVGAWSVVLSRGRIGALAVHVPDVTLRVAEALRELSLPAAVERDVLAVAVQEYVDHVKPAHANDWLALVRAAQAISTERVADYVASLTAYGPLVPNRSSPAGALP